RTFKEHAIGRGQLVEHTADATIGIDDQLARFVYVTRRDAGDGQPAVEVGLAIDLQVRAEFDVEQRRSSKRQVTANTVLDTGSVAATDREDAVVLQVAGNGRGVQVQPAIRADDGRARQAIVRDKQRSAFDPGNAPVTVFTGQVQQSVRAAQGDAAIAGNVVRPDRDAAVEIGDNLPPVKPPRALHCLADVEQAV